MNERTVDDGNAAGNPSETHPEAGNQEGADGAAMSKVGPSPTSGGNPPGAEVAVRHTARQNSMSFLVNSQGSSLLAEGNPLVTADDEVFIRQVNAHACMAQPPDRRKTPTSLEAAIGVTGTIHRNAAIFAFGKWLLKDGKPGFGTHAGPPPDDRTVLMTVAAALARDAFPEGAKRLGRRHSHKFTASVLCHRWKAMYGEELAVWQFTSRITSSLRLLDAYLKHLEAVGRKSTVLKQVFAGLKGAKAKGSRGKPAAAAAAGALPGVETGVPGTPPGAPGANPGLRAGPGSRTVPHATLGIPLEYTSLEKSLEYRGAAHAERALPSLHYRVEPAEVLSTNKGGAVQRRLRGRLVLTPQISVKDDFRTTAVLDRIILFVKTNQPVSGVNLKQKIEDGAGITSSVQDLAFKSRTARWRQTLPDPEPDQAPMRSFAIVLQEPKPEGVARVLSVIEAAFGILGEVRPFLIELSLDFAPARDRAPEERLLLREQMVGLLQRHHWFGWEGGFGPQGDSRQVYVKPGAKPMSSTTDYLFSQPAGAARDRADHELNVPEVRARIAHGKNPNRLYLDATLYRGTQPAGLQVSIQHKHVDKRHPTKPAMVLPEKERRARIEVEISRFPRLKEFGIERVQDLAGFDFRMLKSRYLSFWLCTAPSDTLTWDRTREQFRWRGVYGADLKERQEEMHRRKADRAASSGERAGTGRFGRMLAWEDCNASAGHAVDNLRRAWCRFTWPAR